jgi:type III restriction enzyme
MYPGGVEEYVSVVGTNAFMDFVESIQAEGVVLERKPMGEGTQPKTPLVVEMLGTAVDFAKLVGLETLG